MPGMEGGLAQLIAAMSGSGGGGNPQFPLMPVGDVVPLGRKPGPFQGPTPQSADYMTGRTVDTTGKVSPISKDPQFWTDWVNSIKNRTLIEQMGGLRG